MRRRRRRRTVEPLGSGTFSFDFDPDLLDAILLWAQELGTGLDQDSSALRRLFPTAYPDDPEKDAGYQILAREELIEGRREAIEIMARSVHKEVLSLEEISAWMRTCNDLRLVLGTRLEVGENDEEVFATDDPMAPTMALYRVLGWVVSDIVDGLSADLSST